MFEINVIKDELPDERVKINKRTAVRGIIYDNDKLLMVKTSYGDYKLPGGGVGKNEDLKQALLREIQEETGYCDVSVTCCVGSVFEQNIDNFADDAYFQMKSYYYLCKLNSYKTKQKNLDDYEKEMDFKGVLVDIEEAYNENVRLQNENKKINILGRLIPFWLDREIEVLSVLKNNFIPRIILETYHCGQIIKNADRKNIYIDEKEGRANFVTSYDKMVQEEAKRRFLKVLPDAVFVGEEEDIHESISQGYAFIVDPIDGTTNFMKDYHTSCISVGITLDGKQLAGIVYNPYLDEMFYAKAGEGAYCNGNRITVSGKKLSEGIVIFGTSPYDAHLARKSFDLAYEYFQKSLDVRRSGSAALDLCYVASGRAELYFECILSPWDFAAGSLIVKEAGGKVETLEGEDYCLDKRCSLIARGTSD